MSGESIESAAPAAEPSAPQSTSDIAASVIQTAEAADTGESQGYAEPKAEAKPAPTIAELSEAGKFLKDRGHQAKKADGRDVWLPYGTVEKMLDSYVQQHRGTWDTRHTALERQNQELAAFRDELVADLRGDDTRAFLEKVSQVNPRFREYLQHAAQQTAQADPEPQPDFPVRDASGAVIGHTYSLEGQRKREEWLMRQWGKELDNRMRPLAEREKHAQERAQREQWNQAQLQRTQSHIQEAQSWPGFGQLPADGSLTEFQQSVLNELRTDSEKAQAERRRPTMTLREAYLSAQNKHLAADDTAKRARWIEEANKAATSTAVTRTGVEHRATGGTRTTEDIARQVIAEAAGRR